MEQKRWNLNFNNKMDTRENTELLRGKKCKERITQKKIVCLPRQRDGCNNEPESNRGRKNETRVMLASLFFPCRSLIKNNLMPRYGQNYENEFLVNIYDLKMRISTKCTAIKTTFTTSFPLSFSTSFGNWGTWAPCTQTQRTQQRNSIQYLTIPTY